MPSYIVKYLQADRVSLYINVRCWKVPVNVPMLIVESVPCALAILFPTDEPAL